MRSYNSGKTGSSKIRDLSADMEMLHEKGLTQLRDKTLQKIKSLANTYEQYEAGLDLLHKEWTYNSLQSDSAVYNEHKQLTEKTIVLRKYSFLTNSVLALLKKGVLRNEKLKRQWIKIIQDPVMKNEPEGYREKHYYHQILMLYNERINNFKRSTFHTEALLKNLESRPDLLIENKIKYFGVLVNLTSQRCQNKELEKAMEMMTQLLKIHDWNLNGIERKYLVNCTALSYCNLLAGFTSLGYIKEGLQIAIQAENYIKKNSPETRYNLSLLLNLSVIYLISGNYKEARKWNTTLLNESTQDFREDVLALSRILNLIIHYELKNDELLPYQIRSTYRFLFKRKILYKTEDAILRFIRSKLPHANSRKKLLAYFKELKKELEEITKDPYEVKILDSFDLISWLDSKIQNRPFTDIIKEKALKKVMR